MVTSDVAVGVVGVFRRKIRSVVEVERFLDKHFVGIVGYLDKTVAVVGHRQVVERT